METPVDAPPPAAAPGPLEGLVSMAIEGIAAYAASAVRDGLSRLVAGGGSGGGDRGGERPGGNAPLLLAVAVAAVVTVLLVGRAGGGDPPPAD